MSVVLIDTVKKYAPSVKFHSNEKFFPCSIEHLLQGSTLNYRPWRQAQQIDGQHTSTPALTTFNGWLYMVYTDAHNSDIWVTRSQNGTSWQDTRKIDGQHTSIPAIVAFNGILWMVYSDSNSAQLWVSGSLDGLTWQQARQIPGQGTSVPALAVFTDKIFMVYTDSNNSRIWWTTSTNGWDWSPAQLVPGQFTSIPALTVLNTKLVMAYTDSNSSQLWTTYYTVESGWAAATKIEGQNTSVPALTTIDEWIIMCYSGAHDSQFWSTRSKDGVTWQDTFMIDGQHGSIPALSVLGDTVWMVYTDAHSSQLWVTSSLRGDIAPAPPITNPTQQALQATSPNPGHWVEVNSSQWTGEAIPNAPMYYAVQEGPDEVFIHYIFLYAYQGGQTVTAERSGTEFNCIISPIGTHQGDIERYQVSLAKLPNNEFFFISATFEAHGNKQEYTKSQIAWENDTHAIVSVGLNGHGVYNQLKSGNPAVDDEQKGAVLIGDFFGDLGDKVNDWWRPYSQGSDFRLLGLNSIQQRTPISDQVWAAYCGRLGASQSVGMTSATYFNGSNLSSLDWSFVVGVWSAGSAFGLIPDWLRVADGPYGPGARDWCYPLN